MVDRRRETGRGVALLACALALSFSPAAAEPQDAICSGYGALSDGVPIELGRVARGVPRIPIFKGGEEDRVCPAAAARCRTRAYLVPGDLVILGRTRGDFVCADYVGGTGQERVGWLSTAAVLPETQAPLVYGDWSGRWVREEATIVIEPGKAGTVVVKGDATYGAKDPDRVRRGGVNLGAIEAVVTPRGADLAFTMGEDAAGRGETKSVGKGGPFDCRVWMKRLGPWLLVDDNNNCGGFNVTFRGTYIRKQ